jgi:hypothetical protein
MTRHRSCARQVFGVALWIMTINVGCACDIRQWNSLIAEASDRQQVEVVLIRAVIEVESNACERIGGELTTSSAGAMGLMQLLPATWGVYRDRLRLGNDPYEPHDNILAGSAYLHDLMQQLGPLDGLAAYFAGPQTLTDSHRTRSFPSAATVSYVHDVLSIVGRDTAISARESAPARQDAHSLSGRDPPSHRRVGDTPTVAESTLFAIKHERAVESMADPNTSVGKP